MKKSEQNINYTQIVDWLALALLGFLLYMIISPKKLTCQHNEFSSKCTEEIYLLGLPRL
jgi:hypothetical protein